MGESRQELFAKLDDLPADSPQIPKTQKRINEIEEWMIKQGFIKHITRFGDFTDQSSLYPYKTGFIDFNDVKLIGSLNGKGLNYNKDNTIHNCNLC